MNFPHSANIMIIFFRIILAIMRPTLTRRFVYGYIYSWLCSLLPLNTRYVFFESHNGKNFGGNPYYLAAHLAVETNYRHLRLIMVGPPHRAMWLRQHLRAPNITVVKPRSLRYVFYLATSKWLISDVTFPLYFNRRCGQKYLNTWHGTPLKVLGRHIPGGTKDQLLNSQRNFFHATCILSPNLHTEEMLLDAYCLGWISEGVILRSGYPRNDPLCRLWKRSASFGDVHVAFMPTWRGSLSDRELISRQQLVDLSNLLSLLDCMLPATITLWVKLHPLISGKINFDHYRLIKSFPLDTETYEHLATCDALITDYSSVLFDFAATQRPIFRYVPDEGSYETERGFCLDPDALPFPCARTPSELVALIQGLLDRPGAVMEAQYVRFMKIYNALDRGSSARDVCRVFFTENPRSNLQRTQAPRTMQRVALYIGNQALPPATYASLLGKLDTDRYSFILLIEADAVTQEWESFLRKFNPLFLYIAIRFHAYIAPLEFFRLAWACITHRRSGFEGQVWREIGAREYRRLFGNIELDAFISLDGASIGSRLLKSSRSWYHSGCILPSDIAQDLAENFEYLQKYFRY